MIFPDSKILVGAYYKAPGLKELDVLEGVLFELTVSYEDVILLSDFNENLLGEFSGGCSYCVNHTCTRCAFAGIIAKFDLQSVGDVPSHFPERGRPSLIDLCLVNRPDKVLFFNQVSHGMSKHDLIFGSYSCDKSLSCKLPQFRRNYAGIDVNGLYSDASSIGTKSFMRLMLVRR